MTIGMLFAAGLYIRYFIFGVGTIALAAPILWFEFFSDFQKQRFMAIYAPESLTEATYEEVTAKAYISEAFDFSSILGEGETFLYYKGNVTAGTAGYLCSHIKASGTTSYQFTSVGTYKFAIRTAEYKFYVVTINVTDEVRINETIDTAYAFDLKDGIDTAKLLDAEGNALTGITGINYNGVGYTLNEGKVSFGAVAEMTNEVKALASSTPRTLVRSPSLRVRTAYISYTYSPRQPTMLPTL
jgi:hypothetical protein